MPPLTNKSHDVRWDLGRQPSCTCMHSYCTAALDAIGNREDRLFWDANGHCMIEVVIHRRRLEEYKTLPVTPVIIYKDSPIPYQVRWNGMTVGYLQESELHRRDIRELLLPNLAQWAIDNPCRCFRRYVLTEPQSMADAGRDAAYRIQFHDEDTCAVCSTSDLIPDVSTDWS